MPRDPVNGTGTGNGSNPASNWRGAKRSGRVSRKSAAHPPAADRPAGSGEAGSPGVGDGGVCRELPPLSPAALAEIVAELDTHIAALVLPRRVTRLREVAAQRLTCLTAAFETMVDPHNVSACLRTLEAFGVQTANIVQPVGFQAKEGIARFADRWLTIRQHRRTFDGLADLRRRGFTIWGTAVAPEGAVPAATLPLPPRLCLWFGNEHNGISDEARAACDALVTIPLAGFTESLNVSTAAAILVQEIATRYRAAHAADPGAIDASILSAEQQDALVRFWCRRELVDKLRRPARDAGHDPLLAADE